MSGSVITWNVGGTFFTTSRETVLREPSSRLGLIARGIVPAVQDSTGVYFLDRDPKHFQLLLNWLRDGWCALPASSEARAELLVEARHYQLTGIEAWMKTQDVLAAASSPNSLADLTLSPRKAPSPLGATGAAGTWSPPHGLSAWRPHSPLAAPPSPNVSQPGDAPHQPAAHTLQQFSPGQHAPMQHFSPPHHALGQQVSVGQYAPLQHFSPGRHGVAPGSLSAGMRMTPPASVAMVSTTMQGSLVHAGGSGSLREVFLRATAPLPGPTPQPSYSLAKAAEGDPNKWTAKYVQTNDAVRQVVDTLLELAYLAPHPSLQVGKVAVNITPGQCDHDQISSLVGGVTAQLRGKIQQVCVRSLHSGWTCQFPVRPDSDITLFNKYNIAEVVQDNWFVLTAILKDQFGVLLEEQGAAGRTDVTSTAALDAVTLVTTPAAASDSSMVSPSKKLSGCPACRRHTLAVLLHKIL